MAAKANQKRELDKILLLYTEYKESCKASSITVMTDFAQTIVENDSRLTEFVKAYTSKQKKNLVLDVDDFLAIYNLGKTLDKIDKSGLNYKRDWRGEIGIKLLVALCADRPPWSIETVAFNHSQQHSAVKLAFTKAKGVHLKTAQKCKEGDWLYDIYKTVEGHSKTAECYTKEQTKRLREKYGADVQTWRIAVGTASGNNEGTFVRPIVINRKEIAWTINSVVNAERNCQVSLNTTPFLSSPGEVRPKLRIIVQAVTDIPAGTFTCFADFDRGCLTRCFEQIQIC
jgi:hypothetical protein